MVVHDMQEGVLDLRQAKLVDEHADGIGLMVGHLLEDVEDQTDRVSATPVVNAPDGFNRTR